MKTIEGEQRKFDAQARKLDRGIAKLPGSFSIRESPDATTNRYSALQAAVSRLGNRIFGTAELRYSDEQRDANYARISQLRAACEQSIALARANKSAALSCESDRLRRVVDEERQDRRPWTCFTDMV
jgi:hypothetical protein